MNIVIATGGSGGHIIPALKVAEELRRRRCDVRFVGSFNLWRDRIARAGFRFDELELRGMNLRRPQECVPTFLRYFWATRQCVGLLKQYNTDAVAGFGGYGAFPVVVAAILTHRPALIHEQNVVPGRANAVLSRYARKIAVSFPQGRTYFAGRREVVLTGCPSHVPATAFDRRALLQEFGLREDRKTILVLGGSQGSHRINEIFIEMLVGLKGRSDLQVIHLCGKLDYDSLKSQYASLGLPFALFDFFERMESVYPLADVVVTRAGAVGVTELIRFRKPAVLIPYPHAGGHQRYNADVVCGPGLGRCLEEKDLTCVRLKMALEDILTHPPAPEAWDRHLGEILLGNPALSLADEIIGLKQCD